MYNNQFMLDNLNRQKDRLEDMIKTYQTMPQGPINNIITNGQMIDNTYEMKKLNDNDEVENIAIFKDTIFIGDDRLQIKKLDGTIEKYQIKKTYPRDKKDDKIDELTKKIEELERKLSDEPTNVIKPIERCDEPIANDDGIVEPKPKTTSKSIARPKQTTTSGSDSE